MSQARLQGVSLTGERTSYDFNFTWQQPYIPGPTPTYFLYSTLSSSYAIHDHARVQAASVLSLVQSQGLKHAIDGGELGRAYIQTLHVSNGNSVRYLRLAIMKTSSVMGCFLSSIATKASSVGFGRFFKDGKGALQGRNLQWSESPGLGPSANKMQWLGCCHVPIERSPKIPMGAFCTIRMKKQRHAMDVCERERGSPRCLLPSFMRD